MNKGMLIIISGPSGSGKGTVVKALGPKNNYALSISVTTRQKRADEQDEKDYFFRTVEEFYRMRDADELLEHATFCGNFYGTPKFYVEQKINEGKNVVLEIEVNGALQVKQQYPDCILVFLMPPSMHELKQRLIFRGTEDLDTIEHRFKRAEDEIALIDQYDYLVINDEIENAVYSIDLIVKAEKLKPKRNIDVIEKLRSEI